jgi:putative DNA primase/helicase
LERLTLKNGNRFTRIAAAEEAVVAMQDLASPLKAFVREQCKIGPRDDDGTERQIDVDALYGSFKTWCEDSGHPKSSKEVFGRDLRAAAPSIRRIRPREGGRRYVYTGIRLRTSADDAKDAAAETGTAL